MGQNGAAVVNYNLCETDDDDLLLPLPAIATATATGPQRGSSGSKTKEREWLDCQSLENALKRVRLSCSPGELCLQRDLRDLVASHDWSSASHSPWHATLHAAPREITSGTSGPSRGLRGRGAGAVFHHRSCTYYEKHTSLTGASADEALRLELQYIPPNRLVLRINSSSNGAVQVDVSIPKLYPHHPPIISRIYYSDDEPENRHRLHRHHRLRSIRISSAVSADEDDDENDHDKAAEEAGVASTAALPLSIILRNWSPVQRLSNVIDAVVVAITTQPMHLAREPSHHSSPASSMRLLDPTNHGTAHGTSGRRIHSTPTIGSLHHRSRTEADCATERRRSPPRGRDDSSSSSSASGAPAVDWDMDQSL